MRRLLFCLISNFCFAGVIQSSASALSPETIYKLSVEIRKEVKKQKVAGIAYAITKDGKVIHKGTEGVRDVAQNIPFTLETRTSLGSISKTVITFAIYNLTQKYKDFHIDQKVADILPWFQRPNLAGITVRHLLNHTSGLQRSLGRDSIANLELMYSQKKYGPLYSEITEISKDIELMYNKPGVMPQYSNFGYAVLGSIIVQVATNNGFEFSSSIEEEKLAQYIRKNIFKPLGLEKNMDLMVPSRDFSKESVVYTGLFGDINESPWAFRYIWPVIPNLGMAVAHSGVTSDIIGLAKFNMAIDNMITGKSYPTLSQDAFLEMAKMEARSYDKVAKPTRWGYGNGGLLYEKMKTEKREFLAVGHTGTGYGARTLMFVDPTSGVGVSLIINDKSSNRHAFAHLLFDAVSSDFNPTRMESGFRDRYFEAKNKINQDVALSSEQLELFPQLAGRPLSALDLSNQLKKSSGQDNVMPLLISLGSLEFISGSFGQGSAYQFIFLDGENQVHPKDLKYSQLDQIRVQGMKGGKNIPLFKDNKPFANESIIREGFAPIFLLFAFQQLDFSFDKQGQIQHLIFDRTFYQKARQRQSANSKKMPLEVFPFAKKTLLKDFPFQSL